MRSATSNQDVIRTCESKIRESIKTIGWFEESVRELQEREGGGGGGGVNSGVGATGGGPPPPPKGGAPSYQQPGNYGASPTRQGRMGAGDQAVPAGAGGQAVFGTGNAQSAKQQFTNLGQFSILLFSGCVCAKELIESVRMGRFD